LHAAASAGEVIERVRDATSILLLALCQAAEFRGVGKGATLGHLTSELYSDVRKRASSLGLDRPLDEDIASVSSWIAAGCRKNGGEANIAA
jgi:histidine ammonia-lyase